VRHRSIGAVGDAEDAHFSGEPKRVLCKVFGAARTSGNRATGTGPRPSLASWAPSD